MDRMAQHTKQPELLREVFEALGNDPFVIAECLARPALAEHLLTNWYAYDQRIHGELKQRAQADLLAHPAIEQMNSGTYSEIELMKSNSSDIGQEHGAKTIKLNSHEWDESVQHLAATFNNTDVAQSGAFGVQSRQRGIAALQSSDMSAHSKNATNHYDSLPVEKLSPLQENETCYYATTVLAKTNDRLKLGTVEWPKEPLASWLARAENQPAPISSPAMEYTLPSVAAGCTDDTWTATSGPPDVQGGHTAVWTGSEMIVWGGIRGFTPFNTGGRYNPSTDNWTTTSTTNAPTARNGHTAVWTGHEMIIWGGFNGSNNLGTGGRYNPSTDSWTATSTTNVPTPRSDHTAVWTGSQMIVWGGSGNNNNPLNTGGKYNPGTNSWLATSTSNAPAARLSHTAVWTGNQMIVWGGASSGMGVNTGGRYNPSANSWTATSTSSVPDSRYDHTAVWTGTVMIIWGGNDGGIPFRTGAKYFPGTNTWAATTMTNAPQGRSSHTAVWTGHEMIVWGGFVGGGDTSTGGRYNPSANTWTATSTTNAPNGRSGHTAVWSGSEMIIWDGQSGGRYNPTSDSWAPIGKTPTPRRYHAAVWTGSEMIIWGGVVPVNIDPAFYTNTGGKYNPSTDSWTATTTIRAPTARELPTAVWTGSEMIVWGGYSYDGIDHYWNTGGRYNPGTDSWVATSTTNAPDGRESHTAVWTGSVVIVWGGFDGGNLLNTGGMYNPGTNRWTPLSTTNAPSARDSHGAIWTGSEMIVWGGAGTSGYLNTGGRYDPITNIWAATNIANAPSARSVSGPVWTGSEMIVWGGHFFDGSDHYLNSGGRYNPNTNTWTATSTANAPDGRSLHTAVWTGSEMIVWGGEAGLDLGYYFNTGGRYDPGTDSWTATSTVNAPDGRYRHTAVWTGNEVIVWGGTLYTNTSTNTGGRYCAPGPPAQLGNISTRSFVQTGDNVMIGGFIVQGTGPKRVIIRAIGPELGAPPYNIPNALANPRLELHNAAGALIGSNDDWQHTIIGGVIPRNQVTDIQNSGHAPTNPFESAIIADLPPGNYTAIVSGVNNTAGVGLVEVYDLSANTASILGNISTRSFVQTGDDVMIGGFIVQGTGAKKVIIRAIGPELGAPPYNIPSALANPTLELHNGAGALIASNDNWQTTIIGGIITTNQVRNIINSGHAPTDPRESATIAELPPGNYTAIVRGADNTTGVALVEVYDLD
jgi:N-acetylneuraminic acid mutarotase